MDGHVFHLERMNTPTGPMLVVTDDRDRLRTAEWEDYEDRMHRLLKRHYGPGAVRLAAALRPSAARRALESYFDGDLHAIERVTTATNGTEFQHAVWAALRQIPLGSTISYGTLATRLGRATATRAVGLANGANPTPIVVPCHRVIGADGSLTGFGGGLHRKRWLLAHEGAVVADLLTETTRAGRPSPAPEGPRPSAAPANRR
jgi:methylated-DNA-[protein]-cysteine S-methyltransferase